MTETAIEGWLTVEDPDDVVERSAHLMRVRQEIRRDHPRLTDEQVELIADVAVEIRHAREHVLSVCSARSARR